MWQNIYIQKIKNLFNFQIKFKKFFLAYFNSDKYLIFI